MILVVSPNHLPLLDNSIYLENVDEELKERAGFFKLSSNYIHLFAKALVADSLVPSSRVEDIISCLSNVSGELSLEKIEAYLPEPLSQVILYLRKFFWLDKPLYTIVPGLENTSLIALLSLIYYDTKAEHIIIPYRQYDSKLLEAVVRELEKKFTVFLTIDKLCYQTVFLTAQSKEIWIGPDADLQALLRLRILQPAVEREIELNKKIVVGKEGHYEVSSLNVKWVKKKPYKIITKEPEPVDYLKVVFENEEEYKLVREILEEWVLEVKAPIVKWNFINVTLGDKFKEKATEIYLKLLRHGFIEEILTPGGQMITVSNKTLRVIK